MRGRGLVTLTVALLLALPAQRALAVTIDDIVIVYGENRIDGAFQCYGVSIYLEGASGITDAVVEQVDTGKKYSLTDGGGGFWGWDNHFTSLATFQNLHPTDTQYHFYFNETTPGNYEDEVIVGYALRPLTVFANITYPLHNATGVPLDPVYTWDNIEGMGWGHGKWVRQGDTKVYAVCPDTDMTKVDWQPGTLSPGTTYTIHVGILKITGHQVWELTTREGEVFDYYGLYENRDGHDFTTVDVPEPVSAALIGTAVLGFIGWRRRRMMD